MGWSNCRQGTDESRFAPERKLSLAVAAGVMSSLNMTLGSYNFYYIASVTVSESSTQRLLFNRVKPVRRGKLWCSSDGKVTRAKPA